VIANQDAWGRTDAAGRAGLNTARANGGHALNRQTLRRGGDGCRYTGILNIFAGAFRLFLQGMPGGYLPCCLEEGVLVHGKRYASRAISLDSPPPHFV